MAGWLGQGCPGWIAGPDEKPDELRASLNLEALRGALLKHWSLRNQPAVVAVLEASGGALKAVRERLLRCPGASECGRSVAKRKRTERRAWSSDGRRVLRFTGKIRS